MAEDTTQATNRPYAPPSNVVSVLQRLRSRNLPDRIDNEFLQVAGVPESTIHRVAFALRFLDLVENEKPTDILRAISTSTDEEYRELLGGQVRSAYQEVFEIIDPAQDDSDRIANFFRRYTPASQRVRMVNLFLGLCREAGIPTLDAPRQRKATDSAGPKRRQRSQGTADLATRKPSRKPPQEGSLAGEDDQPSIPPALELLVRSLPPQGATMSAVRRQQWLDMAHATLAFMYPESGDVGGEVIAEDEDV